jgi:hypothetical protein
MPDNTVATKARSRKGAVKPSGNRTQSCITSRATRMQANSPRMQAPRNAVMTRLRYAATFVTVCQSDWEKRHMQFSGFKMALLQITG